MGDNVQVSASIKDRQIYQTLVKLARGVRKAPELINRASGSLTITDATGNNGANNYAVEQTIEVDTGYDYPLDTSRSALDYLTARVYNPEFSTLTGTVGFDFKIVMNEDRRVFLLIDVISGANAFSWTDLTADWVLLDLKP